MTKDNQTKKSSTGNFGKSVIKSLNKGGRPKISRGDARTETMSTRLTVAEKITAMNNVRLSGKLPSVFMREMLMFGKVVAARTQEDRQQVRMLEGGYNNLNQLTRMAHAAGFPEIVPVLEELAKKTILVLDHILDSYDVRH